MIRTVAFAFAVAVLPAHAQTLYKLIDKNGKVTYSGEPPKGFDGKVIRIDVNPDANTVSLPKPGPRGDSGGETGKRAPQGSGEASSPDSVEAARERLDRARKALENARDNPGDADLQRIGKAGGGTRPVFSEDYLKRLESLEDAVRQAEQDLKRAEKGN